MSPAFLLALSPLAGLAVDAVACVLAYRLRPQRGLLSAEYVGLAAGAGSTALLFALLAPFLTGPRGEALGRAFLALASFAALGYCHFHFVNLGETARRIRLLRELKIAGGALSHAELVARYGAREVVERRLARLVGTGQIVRRGDRYYAAGSAVAAMAACMLRLKKLLLGRATEHGA